MPAPSIAVIDTGICNLRSVTKAMEAVGAAVTVVHTPRELQAVGAAGLVLPGVGALRDCVAALKKDGLDSALRDWIGANKPFFGICLGMQALFEHSEEGDIQGLGIFPGKVMRFQIPPEFKVPHMGWNTVRFLQPASPFCANLKADGESFYFVHSYHLATSDQSLVFAECDYGRPFPCAISRGNCIATQFHPEKSQAKGLQLYRNFVNLCAG